ncbi:hypothetical protein JTE90_018760 [Oedothorax gibbosus]|uniref:Uncharacterized protein n=1 Tax=Oedothorax gibbosus TaxID=931172 RepID=A0AAV6UWC7_9ARAC|nr:hypothetical protein JTE90_018760 [Oedothorax gibbosus]
MIRACVLGRGIPIAYHPSPLLYSLAGKSIMTGECADGDRDAGVRRYNSPLFLNQDPKIISLKSEAEKSLLNPASFALRRMWRNDENSPLPHPKALSRASVAGQSYARPSLPEIWLASDCERR